MSNEEKKPLEQRVEETEQALQAEKHKGKTSKRKLVGYLVTGTIGLVILAGFLIFKAKSAKKEISQYSSRQTTQIYEKGTAGIEPADRSSMNHDTLNQEIIRYRNIVNKLEKLGAGDYDQASHFLNYLSSLINESHILLPESIQDRLYDCCVNKSKYSSFWDFSNRPYEKVWLSFADGVKEINNQKPKSATEEESSQVKK